MASKGPWWQDREKLIAAIRHHGSCVAAAAADGGVSPPTLHYWARKHGIELSKSSAGGSSLAEDAPAELALTGGTRQVPWHQDADRLRAALAEHGSIAQTSRATGVSERTIGKWLRRFGIPAPPPGAAPVPPVGVIPEIADDPLLESARRALHRAPDAMSIEELADELDVAPKRARECVEALREEGFRVVDDEATPGAVRLEKLPPVSTNVTRLRLQGDEITIGIVSDTHIGSREQALDELHTIYHEFEARGIDTVLHAGDLVAGVGIYRGQVANGLLPGMHTYKEQVDYATEVYPRIDDITTYIIAGNHDIEGEAGRIGADPVQAVCHRRRDFVYCGAYHGSVELPNGAHATMVHGRGGGGYAISYKPQRYIEGLPPGRKPALLIHGHYHVAGWFEHRSVPSLLAGCFEWQTDLLVRLGLQPAVGAWVMTIRLGDDGSVVGMVPEWIKFHQGRVVEAAKAA